LDKFIGFNGEEVFGDEGEQGLDHGAEDDEGFQRVGGREADLLEIFEKMAVVVVGVIDYLLSQLLEFTRVETRGRRIYYGIQVSFGGASTTGTENGVEMGATEIAAAHGKAVAVGFAAFFFVGVTGHGGLRKDDTFADERRMKVEG
jgi:hypothetical protein